MTDTFSLWFGGFIILLGVVVMLLLVILLITDMFKDYKRSKPKRVDKVLSESRYDYLYKRISSLNDDFMDLQQRLDTHIMMLHEYLGVDHKYNPPKEYLAKTKKRKTK